MNIRHLGFLLAISLATVGCTTVQSREGQAGPVRMEELATLSRQGLTDDALIAQLEQRGVPFVLSPKDFAAQRAAGVSEGVLRYLQGRGRTEQSFSTRFQRSRYGSPMYSRSMRFGSSYFGFGSGAYYSDDLYRYSGSGYGGRGSWGSSWGHSASHFGGHSGGHHHGGRH